MGREFHHYAVPVGFIQAGAMVMIISLNSYWSLIKLYALLIGCTGFFHMEQNSRVTFNIYILPNPNPNTRIV